MIVDPKKRADVRAEWNAVVTLTGWSRGYMAGGTYILQTMPGEFDNLPLVLGYSTLDSVLGQYITEGLFPCKGKRCFNLADKMKSAKAAIQWVDYALVDKGRKARNGIAHGNKLVDSANCRKYIDAIGAELSNWGLI